MKTIAVIFAFISVTTMALEVSEERGFVCKQGDCRNGVGLVFDYNTNLTMEGRFANKQTIPGETYTLRSLRAPNVQWQQVYAENGLLERGDLPRPVGVVNAVPFFRGSYAHIDHPFLRAKVAVPKRGVYDTGNGFEYRGRFEYLPAKSGMNTGLGSGYFIFYGDVVDTEENETESGLYVSTETLSSTPIMFYKANAGYLVAMQKKYQQDMELAKGDFEEMASSKRWRSVIALIGKVAIAFASGGATAFSGDNGGLVGEFALNIVSNTVRNKGEFDLGKMALESLGTTVTGDAQVGKQLGELVGETEQENKLN